MMPLSAINSEAKAPTSAPPVKGALKSAPTSHKRVKSVSFMATAAAASATMPPVSRLSVDLFQTLPHCTDSTAAPTYLAHHPDQPYVIWLRPNGNGYGILVRGENKNRPLDSAGSLEQALQSDQGVITAVKLANVVALKTLPTCRYGAVMEMRLKDAPETSYVVCPRRVEPGFWVRVQGDKSNRLVDGTDKIYRALLPCLALDKAVQAAIAAKKTVNKIVALPGIAKK